MRAALVPPLFHYSSNFKTLENFREKEEKAKIQQNMLHVSVMYSNFLEFQTKWIYSVFPIYPISIVDTLTCWFTPKITRQTLNWIDRNVSKREILVFSVISIFFRYMYLFCQLASCVKREVLSLSQAIKFQRILFSFDVRKIIFDVCST